ncbi:MAG: magnesium transporter [Verrucomicrobiales bacterium]
MSPVTDTPWETLDTLLAEENWPAISEFLLELNADEHRRAFSRLSADEQENIIQHLPAEQAAELLTHLPEEQAADILEELAPADAADIIEEIPADLSADFLQEMSSEDSEEILKELDNNEDAAELRELASYDYYSAGGLMRSQFTHFREEDTIGHVLSDLGENAEKYSDRDVQYLYVLSAAGQLRGVVPLRQLVLSRRSQTLASVMIPEPATVSVDADLRALEAAFDEYKFLALPVIDTDGKLRGIVTRALVMEAAADLQTDDYLSASGIVGGEELRSMPLFLRSRRRLSWLLPNILLNMAAASIIAAHEDTLSSVIALAVFLPMVSDMSGCSGNQAVAVSMRELTMGLIRPAEFMRVLWKEGSLGLINGLVLGTVLGTIAAIWKGNLFLGLVIGSALALNTILSVLLGGLVPLLMKKLKIDPALASGPILTTCTDMCGFFLVLTLASQVLEKL